MTDYPFRLIERIADTPSDWKADAIYIFVETAYHKTERYLRGTTLQPFYQLAVREKTPYFLGIVGPKGTGAVPLDNEQELFEVFGDTARGMMIIAVEMHTIVSAELRTRLNAIAREVQSSRSSQQGHA